LWRAGKLRSSFGDDQPLLNSSNENLHEAHLILVNARSCRGCILAPAAGSTFQSTTGINAMAGHQHDQVVSAAAAKDARNTAGQQPKLDSRRDRRVQDKLEDDDVREALRVLHAERPAGRGPAE
jgi:hypothetical protein